MEPIPFLLVILIVFLLVYTRGKKQENEKPTFDEPLRRIMNAIAITLAVAFFFLYVILGPLLGWRG